MLTFILHSTYVVLVTSELSKPGSFENSVWLGTRSRSKRESSDMSFGLETISLEGTEEVRLGDVCLLRGRTLRDETHEIQSSHPFSWILPLNPLKESMFYSSLQVIGNVSSHVLRPFSLLKANLLQHNGSVLLCCVSLQMNICPENIVLVLNVLEYIVYLPWSSDAYKRLYLAAKKNLTAWSRAVLVWHSELWSTCSFPCKKDHEKEQKK